MKTNVSVLAIGNEVVDGQITNRNAAWLSEQVESLGATPTFHLSCKDNRDDIFASLDFLKKHSRLILVCGGLGPTKDDFSRDCISDWMNVAIEHNSDQWLEIEGKLKRRGVVIREGHRRQAMIPKGALPLANRTGVAPGFFIEHEGLYLVALPGPPNELQVMFNEEVLPLIKTQLNPASEKKLKTWICLGAPESEIAHIVESIVGDEIDLGYRLHKPYVEIKLWLEKKLSQDQKKRIELMESKLEHWIVGRSIKEIRQGFNQYLAGFDFVFVVDQLTSGLMLEKLKEEKGADNLRYQSFEHKNFRHFNQEEVSQIISHMGLGQMPNNLVLGLFPHSETSALLSFNDEIVRVELPRNIPTSSKLGQAYAIEHCFLKKQSR